MSVIFCVERPSEEAAPMGREMELCVHLAVHEV